MKGLTGKRIVITGGTRGIGLETTRRFLTEGARVAVIDRDAPAAPITESVATDRPPKDWAATGTTRALFFQTDVTDATALDDTFGHIADALGGIDVLVNNAGIGPPLGLLDASPEDWRRVIDTNLTGVYFCAQRAGRLMQMGGGGLILNMGSVSGLIGMPNFSAYDASKAAIIQLTRDIALELAPSVRAVAVCPGFVLTPLLEAERTPEELAEMAKSVPVRRMAKPAEVAALFAFLASDEATFFNGSAIVMDGGEMAGGLASHW